MFKFAKFLVLPLMATFALTGCDFSLEEMISSLGSIEGSISLPENTGEELPIPVEESKNKLLELAQTKGIEANITAKASGEEEVELVVGIKGNSAWYYADEEKSGYKLVDNELYAYSYDAEEEKYNPTLMPVENPQGIYDEFVQSSTIALFYAYGFDGGFTKVGSTTHAGRAATEYSYSFVALGVSVQWKVVIDNELGITLFWGASGTNAEGESGSASYDVTSFKLGDDVVAPF